jgi:hypothetical protein
MQRVCPCAYESPQVYQNSAFRVLAQGISLAPDKLHLMPLLLELSQVPQGKCNLQYTFFGKALQGLLYCLHDLPYYLSALCIHRTQSILFCYLSMLFSSLLKFIL